jgi:hypothetical protein
MIVVFHCGIVEQLCILVLYKTIILTSLSANEKMASSTNF